MNNFCPSLLPQVCNMNSKTSFLSSYEKEMQRLLFYFGNLVPLWEKLQIMQFFPHLFL